MAHILQSSVVRYACSCGSLKPLSRIYFCRHCLKIRCGYCVSHEVDSHYCANCLENLPSAEARLKKQRCAGCFDCPSCLHTLSTKATTVIVSANADDKPVAKKLYYLSCGFCRWTTRDIGVADQTVASGGWTEKENPNASKINNLLDHLKTVALRERQEKEKKKKFNTRRNYFHLSGLTSALARKRAGLSSLGPSSLKDDLSEPPEFEPPVASEEVEQLPPEAFTKPIDLLKVTTLKQRLAHPEFQPETVNDLYPAHKCLLIKRSQRCRTCEHNVSKPEFNPGSIKFKIQLSAHYHVPEVRKMTCELLREGENSELLIKICNPTQYQSAVKFFPLPSAEEEAEELRKEIEERTQRVDRKDEKSREDSLPHLPSLCRQVSICEDPRPVNVTLTGDVELPDITLILPPRDDAAEYDDSGDTYNFHDDPKIVIWRKANKAAVKLVVTSHSDLSEGSEVIVGFEMHYTYVNTIAALEQKEPQKVDLKVKVFINVGKTLGK